MSTVGGPTSLEAERTFREILFRTRRTSSSANSHLFGIRQSRYRVRYEEWLALILPTVELAVIGYSTAREYAQIRLELKMSATPIPANDAWIAALARQHSLPVCSNDTHFDVVSGITRIAF